MNYSHCNMIKFIGFKPIYHTINPSDVLSSMIFSDLISMFLLIYC